MASEVALHATHVSADAVDLPRLELISGDPEPRKGRRTREGGTWPTIQHGSDGALLQGRWCPDEPEHPRGHPFPASTPDQPAAGVGRQLRELVDREQTVLCCRQVPRDGLVSHHNQAATSV